MKRWNHGEKAELANLYHLARVPLAGTGNDTPYQRKLWAANAYATAHPEVSSTTAYKELCRQAGGLR